MPGKYQGTHIVNECLPLSTTSEDIQCQSLCIVKNGVTMSKTEINAGKSIKSFTEITLQISHFSYPVYFKTTATK